MGTSKPASERQTQAQHAPKLSTRFLTWIQTDRQLKGQGLQLHMRIHACGGVVPEPGGKWPGEGLEDDLLLAVNWALNVMGNAGTRPDAILAFLGVPVELWQHRPWEEKPVKDVSDAWAHACDLAMELKGLAVAAGAQMLMCHVPAAGQQRAAVAGQPQPAGSHRGRRRYAQRAQAPPA
jgi:hypothetical protein